MLIGICGKSGSGKSLICKSLSDMGAYVIDADKIGKSIMTGDVIEEIKKEFSHCFDDGVLIRKKLAFTVFNDEKQLGILNGITHPAIRKQIEQLISENIDLYEFIVVDAAVLIEAGMRDMFDCTVAVIASDDIRKRRIMARDNISDDEANARISSQNDDDYYIKNTDFYIMNSDDNSPESTAASILERSKEYASKHS